MFGWKRTEDRVARAYDELHERLEIAEKALKRLLDEIEDMDVKYTRLRGLVYARKLHKAPAPEEGAQPTEPARGAVDDMSREELKKHLTRSGRFIPGRPTHHDEE